ncbi:MAG: ABC transporter ATP-binding protein [Desulfobacterales bacterium]|nr:ABC transporter ATP-binding protein [Desulfobacterales bacterium]
MQDDIFSRKILLDVTKLEVIYNKSSLAIQGVSLKVPEETIVAILGVNGAGKTTTLRAISGFLGSDAADIKDGLIRFEGKKLNGKYPHEIAREGVILVPERQKIFETLTVKENLMVGAGRIKKSHLKEALDKVYFYFPVLDQRSSAVAGYLSGGERQMLAIGSALLCSPKLLLLDEFSLGLAPLVVDFLTEVLESLRNDLGLTILLVEQNATAALKIADYGYIMENGRVVFEGAPERLMSHEDVKEFYLGIGSAGSKNYRDVKQYSRTRRWWG